MLNALPLILEGDPSARMVAGSKEFLLRETRNTIGRRPDLWKRDFSSIDTYYKSIAPNRDRFRRYIGASDRRASRTFLEYVPSTNPSAKISETENYTVYSVRWLSFGEVYGEGLLLQPKMKPLARIVAIPDADQTPEMLVGLSSGIPTKSQFARRLAESGCQVLVPSLVDRQDNWSGSDTLESRFYIRRTNLPHREWIYRQAYEMGRHIIGYEVQQVLAAVDCLEELAAGDSRIGVAGYGEGGLIAFYSAALDSRIASTLVSGYFGSRQRVWEEPIYRDVWGLLHEFGDAEIASMVAPRSLVIEYSSVPKVAGPPKPIDGRSGNAAPGRLWTPSLETVNAEIIRAKSFFAMQGIVRPDITLIAGENAETIEFGSEKALRAFLDGLGVIKEMSALGTSPEDQRTYFNSDDRQKRQVKQLEAHTQKLVRLSEHVRTDFFWNKLKTNSPAQWATDINPFKEYFWEEVLGRFPKADLPLNARARKIYDEPKWSGYEVVLDVWKDVFVWGYLLVPKDIKLGEKRPVVVCQHGLEGVPADTVEGESSAGYKYYKSFAARLAEEGFVTFAPHNPYRGGDRFRELQRIANPLKKSLFSIIVGQHDRILDWLSELPFVDRTRIGFYGLSYGGKTAMRVPAVLDRYALSICSADFNEWIKKNATVDSGYSYLFTIEYEMPEFNLGHTFNYAEMAGLIAPRPFMVERGHHDGVGPDEWVAYEFAKVRQIYAYLRIPDRTTIEFFNGPHTINGVGTFEFLHKHLNLPKR